MKERIRGRPRRDDDGRHGRADTLARMVRRNRQAFAALGLTLLIAFAALYGLPREKRLAGAEALMARGKADYGRLCADCHGAGGAGGSRGPSLLAARFNASRYGDGKLLRVLSDGIPAVAGHPVSADPAALAAYIRALQGGQP